MGQVLKASRHEEGMMTVYLLSLKASPDWNALPDVDAKHTAKDVAQALRDAADELEDYADWRIGQGTAGNDPVVLEIDWSPSFPVLVDRVMSAAAERFGLKYLRVDGVDWSDRAYRDVDFPDWALCTLVNGDPLEDDEDRRTYDDWTRRMLADGYDLLSPDILDDRNEFRAHPAFGLACGTTKVRFFKREAEHAT